ncbi:MAG: hypothetical protein N2C14_10580 [Planctomycetales bacterium]
MSDPVREEDLASAETTIWDETPDELMQEIRSRKRNISQSAPDSQEPEALNKPSEASSLASEE